MDCICQNIAGLSIVLLTSAPVAVFVVCAYLDFKRMTNNPRVNQ